MNKKSILIIAIALILVVIGFMAFTTDNSSQVRVGDALFELPTGFHEGTPNSAGDVNITNGYDTVFIKEYNQSNITKCINSYKNYKKTTNNSVKLSNSSIGDTEVYKSTLANQSNAIHYWFVYKDKVYSIYSGKDSSNIEDIAPDLIKSLK